MSYVFTTARLGFRIPEDADLDFLARMYAESATMRFIGSGEVRDRAGAEASLRRMQAAFQEHGYGLWITCRLADDTPVGRCGLIHQTIEGVEELEVGYMLEEAARGRGLGTEAAQGIRNWALRELGATRLISLIYPDNAASIRVAEKNGMQFERMVQADFPRPVCVYVLNAVV